MISEAGRPCRRKGFPLGISQIWLVHHLQNCSKNGHRKLSFYNVVCRLTLSTLGHVMITEAGGP